MLTIVPVADIPAPVLVENIDKFSDADKFKIYKTCLQLRQLCDKEVGVGISAVQAGIPLNLFLIKLSNIYSYFLDCNYTPVGEDKILHIEGCLSLRTSKGVLRKFEVERYQKISINGYRLRDETDLYFEHLKDYYVEGFPAIVFQHEIDHGSGILISDIGKEIDIERIK